MAPHKIVHPSSASLASEKLVLPPLCHGGEVYTASFNSAGDRLVTASSDGTRRLWDVQVIKPDLILSHDAQLIDVAFSSDGQRIVTGSWDGTARIWNRQDGSMATPPLQHNGQALAAAGEGPNLNSAEARVWTLSPTDLPSALYSCSSRRNTSSK